LRFDESQRHGARALLPLRSNHAQLTSVERERDRVAMWARMRRAAAQVRRAPLRQQLAKHPRRIVRIRNWALVSNRARSALPDRPAQLAIAAGVFLDPLAALTHQRAAMLGERRLPNGHGFFIGAAAAPMKKP